MTDRQRKETQFNALRKEMKIFLTMNNPIDKRVWADSIRDKLISLSVYESLFTHTQCVCFDRLCNAYRLDWLTINKRAKVFSNFLLNFELVVKLKDHDSDLIMNPEKLWDIFVLIRNNPNTWGKLLDSDSVKGFADFIAAFPACYGVESLKEFKEVMTKYIDELGIN